MNRLIVIFVFLCYNFTSFNLYAKGKSMNNLTPPLPKRASHVFEYHGDKIQDDFAWMHDENWPDSHNEEVVPYIEAENGYVQSVMEGRQGITDAIFAELKGRVKNDDESVPVKRGDYYYYRFIKDGQNYFAHARKRGSLDAEVEVYLDENELAEGKSYMQAGHTVSDDNNLLAYVVDYEGDERFSIYVKDLKTGKFLDDVLDRASGRVIWHSNNQGFFYLPQEKVKDIPRKVMYHEIGKPRSEDILIYEEQDDSLGVFVSKTSDKKYILVGSGSYDFNETYYIDVADQSMTHHLISKRQEGHKYSVTHHGEYFYITTNDKGDNYRVVKAPDSNPSPENWQEIIPNSDEPIEQFSVYKDFMVITTQKHGLNKIKVINFADNKEQLITFDEPSYVAGYHGLPFESDKVRFSYTSLNTPASVKEYDPKTDGVKLLKVQEIPSGFQRQEYEVELIHAIARDGVEVPISLVYKKDLFFGDGSNPLYLYGYGSYGSTVSPGFNKNIISLVDRGFVYAIAHIRGGGFLGESWHKEAKILTRKKTFEDFIDCTQYLIDEQYTSKGNIAISGRSAGGTLMGVVLNEEPDLYKVAVLGVPRTDVLNRMMDINKRATKLHFDELGNPIESREVYDYLKSYCPYLNIKAQDYPAMLVTSGLADPRVPYWDPTKWVAKLRYNKTDDNILLLKANMEAGHFGKTGRFKYLEELAFEYSFILKVFEEGGYEYKQPYEEDGIEANELRTDVDLEHNDL